MNKYAKYEKEKAKLQKKMLPPDEYARRIAALAKRLGI